MNNLFETLDSLDLTSILTEDESSKDSKFCTKCFNEFEGEGDICSNCKDTKNLNEISDLDRQVITITNEIDDELAIQGYMDITELDYNEQKSLILDVMDRIYSSPDAELFNAVVKELGLNSERVTIGESVISEAEGSFERKNVYSYSFYPSDVVEGEYVYNGTSYWVNIYVTNGESLSLDDVLASDIHWVYLDEYMSYDQSEDDSEVRYADDLPEDIEKEMLVDLIDFWNSEPVVKDNLPLNESVEEDINDLQSILSGLKQGVEGLDKAGTDSFDYMGKSYTKDKAQKEISKIERELNKLNKDKNDDLSNAFGDNKLSEAYDSSMTFEQWFDKTYPETHRVEDNDEFYPFNNYVKSFPDAEVLRNATAQDIKDNAKNFYDVYPVDSADREEAFNFASEVLGIDYDSLFNDFLEDDKSVSIKESTESNLSRYKEIAEQAANILIELFDEYGEPFTGAKINYSGRSDDSSNENFEYMTTTVVEGLKYKFEDVGSFDLDVIFLVGEEDNKGIWLHSDISGITGSGLDDTDTYVNRSTDIYKFVNTVASKIFSAYENGRLNKDDSSDGGLSEAIQTVTTVDNIDQESKDKSTIDKAIELAGDKNKIDNDKFRELRLALANKDYDVVDRTKDYALVRGEDVIYTWLRVEDENLKESNNLKLIKRTLNESVSWDYFDRFRDITDGYMPSSGEGETMASQIVTAVNKLVYKWYNDGDVYDNSNPAVEGWCNDLSSYANWLAQNIDGAKEILDRIFDLSYSDMNDGYEDILKDLANNCLDSNVINGYKDKPKDGSIYSCQGDYAFDEGRNYDEDDYYESVHVKNSKALNESDSREELDNFYNEVREVFGRDLPENEEGGLIVDEDKEIVILPAFDEDSNLVNGITFLINGLYVVCSVDGGEVDIRAPHLIKDKDGVSYGDSITFYDKDISQAPMMLEVVKGALKPIISADSAGGYAKIRESEDLKEEDVSYEEIITRMSNAESYDDLRDAASLIVDASIRADVEDVIDICEEDGDPVDVAYSVATSDYLDMRINDLNEEILKDPKDIEDSDKEELDEEGVQVSDIPPKNDQGKSGKRLELAKLENEDKASYRISYLKEDEEVLGWDIPAESDEEALDIFNNFDDSSDIIDDLSDVEFTETPIDGVSTASYDDVDLALSISEDGQSLLTVTSKEGVPVVIKGESLDDITTKLIYWFIMGPNSTSKEVL